ncbi:MAG: AraC family transcriptional regulator [Burkholderiaceae bacterium]
MVNPALSTATAEMRRYRGDHGHHEHAHAQLLFGVDGALDVEVDGHLMRVDATTGLVVPAGSSHASFSRHGAQVLVIDSPASREFDRLRPFALSGGRPQAIAVEPWLALARVAPRAAPRRKLDVALLEAAVRNRLHGHWPTERMAKVFAMSASQFHARWRELTGQTPQAWLRARRLDEAARLLRGGLLVDAVAAQVGYASASALLFSLRRERGVGSRALRKR